MKTHFAKRTLSILLTVCMLVTSLTLPIFAVTAWSSTEGTRIYVATDSNYVDVYDYNDEAVRYANLFAREYLDKLGVEPLIIFGAKADARSGDIILELNPEQKIGSEGYSISVSTDKLTVTASDASGLLYGYRDVLKQLLVDNTVEAVANHVPNVAERTVSLDNSRKYFSPDWIKELIREMSWVGMNTLVTNSNAYLTQKQFADIAEYAALYRVELVSSGTPANPNVPQISVTGDTLYIRCDDPTLQTPEQMMEEIKPQLRALAAKSWNDSVSTDAWAKIGDAPVIAIPDTSAVQALIDEYYNTYLPKENTYTSSTFDAYENEVLNAEGFAGLNSFRYNPELFVILEEEILKYRPQLTPLGNTALLLTAIAAYEAKAVEKDKYSPESWSIYETSYIACKNMLAGRDYTESKVSEMVMGMSMIPQYGLILESDVAGLRKEALTSAKFQAATVYQGGTAKLSVIVPRGNGVKDIRVVDENGIVVAYGKAQPINILKPKQVTYIVNIPASELGTHTYTVYATYKYTGGLLCDYLYCSDPIQCQLTVLE
jgi:hypothetical protein